MLSRKPPYWPERINPQMTLRSAIDWMELDLRRCDLYRCLALCEAISIIQWAIDACDVDSIRRNEQMREELKKKYELRPVRSGA